jgi:hypothetical protein
MLAFVQWLQSTPLSLTIRKIAWVIPLLQTLHILAIGLVLAAVVMIDMRVWGWSRSEPLSLRARRFLPWLWVAMVVLTATGIALIMAAPRRTLLDPTFQVKMIMMAVAIAATLWFAAALRRRGDTWDHDRFGRRMAGVLAAATLLLWVGVTFAGRGRWIANLL